MSDLDSLFADMAGASGSSSGVYFTEGTYTVTLKQIEYIPNGYKGKSCKFHFTVDTSSTEEVKAQSSRVWICKLDKSKDQNKRTFADIKNLVFALTGQDPVALKDPAAQPKAHEQATAAFKAAIDATFAAESKIPQTFLIGRKCALEAQKITTAAKEGKPAGEFTRHVWSPLPKAV